MQPNCYSIRPDDVMSVSFLFLTLNVDQRDLSINLILVEFLRKEFLLYFVTMITFMHERVDRPKCTNGFDSLQF